ncbi:MAG: DNA-binding protein WhiA [Ruminococcus sp.]|nr:DNA-binding protein WhiA [Ruminococcus sp.]MBQ1815529.1 DNA-binding protein WhiA [Ruminococcus sp.]
MSFSSEVKKELCSNEIFDREALKAELYGMLLFGKSFSADTIVFTTENKHVCKRAAMLLENLYMPILEKQSVLRTRAVEGRLYRLSVVDSRECKRIFEDYGHSQGEVTLRVNRANIPGDEAAAGFIRGVFLCCGSVADPEKNYHAEFCVPHRNISQDLCRLLTEVTECEFTPKTVVRNGNYVVYFKGSEQICDLMTYIGAPRGAMEIMGAKAVKQVRNNINRRINGEVANIGKIASASAKQLEAIKYIKANIGLETLPEELREIAYLRLENPEMSLRDLGQHLSPPISRSGANHRIMRLMEYYKKPD